MNPWEMDTNEPECSCPEGGVLEIADLCASCYLDYTGEVKPEPRPASPRFVDPFSNAEDINF